MCHNKRLRLGWALVATAAAIDCDGQGALIGCFGHITPLDQLGSNGWPSSLGPDILRTIQLCLSA